MFCYTGTKKALSVQKERLAWKAAHPDSHIYLGANGEVVKDGPYEFSELTESLVRDGYIAECCMLVIPRSRK